MPQGNSTNERLTRVESAVANLAQEFTHVRADIASIAQVQSASRITNWPLIMTMIGAGASVLAGLFVTLNARQEITSLRSELEMVRYIQPVVVSAEQSRADRAAMHQKVDENSQKISLLAGQVSANHAEWRSNVAEIEAQFKGVGNISNLRSQEQQRILGLIWRKVYGEELPPNSFYPSSHREFIPTANK